MWAASERPYCHCALLLVIFSLHIVLWDLSTGTKITTYKGHTDVIHSIAFSGEGSLLASGGADNTVRIWDVQSETGNPLVENTASPEADGTTAGATNGTVGTLGGNPITSVERAPGGTEFGIELATFPTKRTPVLLAAFTNKNLLLVGGPFSHADDSST
eukprot:m.1273976 g.1273976  ORF g.1273976 m.1273976 type:complete len:159 (+) comp24756_c0_seq13:2268-2744(+)